MEELLDFVMIDFQTFVLYCPNCKKNVFWGNGQNLLSPESENILCEIRAKQSKIHSEICGK